MNRINKFRKWASDPRCPMSKAARLVERNQNIDIASSTWGVDKSELRKYCKFLRIKHRKF